MHKNFFHFRASTHLELGKAMGKKFRIQAEEAILTAQQHKKWALHRKIAQQLLRYADKHFPEYVEELRGYAAGASVNFEDFWTVSLEDDAFVHPHGSAKCSTIVTNHGHLIGHNEDSYEPGHENDVCVVQKTLGKMSTLEIFYYNTAGGSSIGINSHGFVHAINTLLYTSKHLGVPKNIIARYLLDTQNPTDDLEQIKTLPRASGYNHTLVSPLGEIWQAEFTSKTAQVLQPSLPYAHTNHCVINRSGVSVRNLYGTSSRLKTAQKKTQPRMTEKELAQVLNDQSRGGHESLHNERTIGKMIVNQKTRKTKIWLLREKEAGWVTYSLA